MRSLNSWTRLLGLLLVGLAVRGPAIEPVGAAPAGQPFLAADGQLRAEVRGLSARFDATGAHLLAARGAAPISLRTGGVGRGAITHVPATAPTLGGRGLEYSSAGVREWWGAGLGGFEQGWVVHERPRGTGPLRIRVEVHNAAVAVEHGDLTLRGARRHTLTVGGLHAVDAAGEPIAVRFEAAPDGFDVVVEDDGAAYPVEVDPVYTSPDWTVEGTPGFGAADLGRVVPAGDTNGDGYDDVIVQDDDGVAYLFQGGASGMEPIAASILACVGPADGAGDVDGDGYDDVVVASAAGEVSVYSGGASGLSDARTSVVMDPEGQSHSFNEALSGAGDVNGDGFDDLVVAAPRDDEEGRLYLFLGSALGVSGSPTTTLQGDYGGEFGTVVSDAGDVNGDGFGDVIVASPDYESSIVRVYLGSPAGLDRTPVYQNYGSIYDVGTSLSPASDVNGDGYDDVLIGTGKCWAHCWDAYYGRVDVVPGSAAGPEDQGWSISGDSPETAVGYEVSGAGDVDGDGFDDVMVGATVYRGGPTGVDFASPLPLAIASSFAAAAGVGDANGDGFTDVVGTTSGAAALYLGSSAADFSAALEFGATGDYLGAALASAGDVNGDGYEDVIVGTDPQRGDGSRALVYLGSALGIASAANVELSGSAGDHFGFAVAGAGDVNGDGYDDVVIGAYSSGDGGAVYVYLGSDAGIDPATATALVGDSALNGLGYRVARVGDINGDGYSDVAVGMLNGDDYLLLYEGSARGISTEPSFELALAGPPTCVAPVGDLNGDGFADFAIGLANDDNGPGEVQVFHGSAMGPPSSASVTLVGEAVSDHFGHSVAAAGDVDGDGYDDLVVGAYGSDLEGADSPWGPADTGRVYVYSGGPGGLGASPSASVSGSADSDELGSWVAPGGDSDGDGFDEVLAVAPGWDGHGAILVFAGSATGISETPRSSASGFVSLRYPVATADVNGDGLWDVLASDLDQPGYGGRVGAWYGCVDGDVDGVCAGPDCDDADPAVGALFADGDGDGFGNVAASLDVCTTTLGYVSGASDCDDTDAGVNPGADELCDRAGVDEDCDGSANESDAVDASTWYEDDDADGYTDPDARTVACVPPSDFAAASAEPDCDDHSWTVNPDAEEVCDGVDNNCDGAVDAGAVDPLTWYADLDGDDYGDRDLTFVACNVIPGFIGPRDGFDCDDANPDAYPGANDRPGDGVDQDCDGEDAHTGCGGCSTPSNSPLASLALLAVLAIRRRGDRSRRPLAGPPARPAEEQHGERDAQGTRP